MSNYIKFYDGAARWLRIVLSVVCVPAFLYRLFKVIIDKAEDKSKLIYLILSVIPFIGTVIFVVDIVWCALCRELPLCFADWTNSRPVAPEAEVVNEKKDEK